MAINVGNLVVNNTEKQESSTKEVLVTTKSMPDHTVMINGKPKKFHKKMSQYMIDMLTTEEE